MARQSQLLRGVFPALFHPLPAPVWADDVDNRVNFGMNIGMCVCVCLRVPVSNVHLMLSTHWCVTVLLSSPFFSPVHQVRLEGSSKQVTWWSWWRAGSRGQDTPTSWGRSVWSSWTLDTTPSQWTAATWETSTNITVAEVEIFFQKKMFMLCNVSKRWLQIKLEREHTVLLSVCEAEAALLQAGPSLLDQDNKSLCGTSSLNRLHWV